MSVLLVTDASDDDIKIPKHEHLYQQIKELEYKFTPIESSLSIVGNPKKTYHRQRRYRPQQCLVKYLFTYMLTLLFLTNHFHWSIIFFSLSSIKFMSTYASTTATPLTSKQLPSIINEDEQQCLSIKTSYIDRICSKTCRARKTPFEQFDNFNRELSSESHFLPFCSNHTLNHSINQTYLFDNITENECREIFNQLIKLDEEARKASELFVTYMEAIDSASDENRYSIIIADCQQAYRTWTCSVNIPYYHQNRRIPPCQTICDEVERVCPTFRPSDREPLFAGQPLFFCNGGIVTNSNYGHRPHCFDTCHLGDGSSQRHSVSSSSNQSLLTKIVKEHVTTPLCFEIEPLISSPTEQSLFVNDSITNYTSNSSMSASAVSIISSSCSSIIVNMITFIIVLLLKT